MKQILLGLLIASSLAACVPMFGPGSHHHRGRLPVAGNHAVPMQLSFDAIDRNQDKRISRLEFVGSEFLAPPDSYVPTKEELFERIDKNGDGVVSRHEYNKHLGRPPFPAV